MNDREAILDRLKNDRKFLLTTHENPDGDAIGSLVGMSLILREMGKDTVMFMPAGEFPLPQECSWLAADGEFIKEQPDDLAERTVIYLDCATFERMDVDFLRSDQLTLINIDHHHDNPGYGDLDLVEAERSSTAEAVYFLAQDLGVALTRGIADALYVGVVTDTGRFMYTNTTPETHRMAAGLLAAGVDVRAVFTRLFEDMPAARIELMGRALARLQQFDDGRLTIVNLTRADFDETGSEEAFTEGIIDKVRAVKGSLVAALYREMTSDGGEQRAKISLRSKDARIDVSAITRIFGGGGHKQAAGATTDKSLDQAIDLIRAAISEQLDAAAA